MSAYPDQDSIAPRLWDGFLTQAVPPLTAEEQARFAGKRILITGAGGFLGSALARALIRLSVARLVLLDSAEYGLYRLDQELRAARHTAEIVLPIGNVGDEALLRELFARHAPEIVLHAAALKHVPLMECNAVAAAETNILGTQALLAEAAAQPQVESFVYLSTDKAVEPISIMGATKRIAEQAVLSAREQHPLVNAVRLCNVLGSTGSVAPLFARQIARGGPLTVTHPKATRYFISEADAVHHLLRAATVRTNTGLLVPVTGDPARIEDLARHMIERSPHAESSCAIVHTGLRAADKLHEQLVASSESVATPPALPFLAAVQTSFELTRLEQALSELRRAVSHRDHSRLLQAIRLAVPEYKSQLADVRLRVGSGP